MLKVIFEQPQAVKETFEKRVHNGKVDFSDVLNYEDIKNINKIIYSCLWNSLSCRTSRTVCSSENSKT